MKILYKYVPMGMLASSKLDSNEFWLDVGGRDDEHVFDHHHGGTNANSATELVLKRATEIINDSNSKDVVFVLHEKPDLDAISAAWLLELILNKSILKHNIEAVKILVKEVTLNDQGYINVENLYSSWILVMKARIAQELKRELGFEIKEIISLLNATLSILENNGSLEMAAQELITENIREVFQEAEREYLYDIQNARMFQVSLPLKEQCDDSIKSKTVDAIVFKNPTCSLIRELARGDSKRSPLGNGFTMMMVCKDVKDMWYGFKLTRYILSTDPCVNVSLKGLGRQLELEEQKKEEALSIPLRTGRQRKEWGSGRNGYNVDNPWYDGCGHDFTIIDTPYFIGYDGTRGYGSILSNDEVLQEVLTFSNGKKVEG